MKQFPLSIKRRLFVITFLLFSAIFLTAGSPTPPVAPAPPPDLMQQMNQTINELRSIILDLTFNNEALERDVERLRERLEAETGPRPIYDPNVRLVSPTGLTLLAGETADINITLRNIGTHHAFNLLTQAHPSAGAPFSVEFLNDSNIVRQINENQQVTMLLRITVADDAESGTFDILLRTFFRTYDRDNERSEDDIFVRIIGVDQNDTEDARVRLGSFSTPPGPFAAGGNFTVNALLQNVGSGVATDIVVDLSGIAADGVFFTGDLNQAARARLEPGESVPLTFTFSSNPAAATDIYRIDFEVTYRDHRGVQEAAPSAFFASIQGTPRQYAALEVTNMTTPAARLGVGESGTVSFYVQNVGTYVARGIIIESIPSPEAAGHVFPQGPGTIFIPQLLPGQSRHVSFSFAPTSAAETRSYNIRFNLSFELDNGDESTTIPFFASILAFNPEREEDDEDARTQIPRVIVSAYSVDPMIPRAGREFDMEITFWNTNASQSVNNIVVTLEPLEMTEGQGFVFIPVGASNTHFIPNLAPNETVTRQMRFFTVADAAPRSYNMRVTFNYQDSDFFEHTFSENLSITVAQITRLEVDGLNVDSVGMVGNPIWNRFQVLNTGRVAIDNVWVDVEGPFDTSGSRVYVGPLPAGRTVTYDGEFVPLEGGLSHGYFTVTGEDPMGEVVELRIPFTIDVMGGMDMEFPPMDGAFPPFDGGFPGEWPGDMGGDGDGLFITRPVVWIPLASVVAIAAGVAIFLVRRKKSKLEFLEGDDEI